MHIAVYGCVWGGSMQLWLDGNVRETIKIELLECTGCLIQWFIQIRYRDMCSSGTDTHRDGAIWSWSLAVCWIPIHCICLFAAQCAGASGPFSSRHAHEPCCESNCVAAFWEKNPPKNKQKSKRLPLRAVVIFNCLDRPHTIVELLPGLVWVSYSPLTFLQMPLIGCGDVLSADHRDFYIFFQMLPFEILFTSWQLRKLNKCNCANIAAQVLQLLSSLCLRLSLPLSLCLCLPGFHS